MLTELERRALEMLLDGADSRLVVLRRQLREAIVERRVSSGAGFFTHLSVAAGIPRLDGSKRLIIGDVYADVTGLQNPAGFLLFVINGAIEMLECFIVDDAWPDGATIERAYYVHPSTPGGSNFVETKERDLGWAMKAAD